MLRWCGPQRDGPHRRGWPALPLWAWLLTVAAMSFGGPGDDVILGGQGLLVYGALVFVVAGAVPPAWVLWRRRVQADGSG